MTKNSYVDNTGKFYIDFYYETKSFLSKTNGLFSEWEFQQ
jgi:hypothetical protein